jgi:hypothetical protein
MNQANEQEAASLWTQAAANRLHAELNPTLSTRQRKQLLRVADRMMAHAFAITPVDQVTAAMSDDELLEALGV